MIRSLAWRGEEAFKSRLDVFRYQRPSFLLFTWHCLEQNTCTHPQRTINGMTICAARLVYDLTASSNFTETALRCLRPSINNAIDDVIEYRPSKIKIELKNAFEVFLDPPPHGVS